MRFLKARHLCVLLVSTGLLFSAACAEEVATAAPLAQQGLLDLRAISFADSARTAVRLNGRWNFFAQRFVPPDEIAEAAPDAFADVPGVWNQIQTANNSHTASQAAAHSVSQSIFGPHGHATYHLRIRFSEPQPPLALAVGDVFTAYRIYVNAKLIGASGEPAATPATARPRLKPDLLLLPATGETLDLVLHVSGYDYRFGGLWSGLELGEATAMRRAREGRLMTALFLAGALFIFGLYHIAMYVRGARETALLYFGVFCVLLSVRGLVVGDRALAQLLPDLAFAWQLRIEYIDLFWSMPVFLAFWRRLFPEEMPDLLIRALMLLAGLFTLATLALPSTLFTNLILPWQLLMLVVGTFGIASLVLSLVRYRAQAQLFFAGWMVFFLTVLNDLLHFNHLITSLPLAPAGSFMFVLIQASLLSERFRSALNTAEELSVNLEDTVARRTAELRDQKDQADHMRREIEELNEFARQVNARADLDGIMDRIISYSRETYGIEGVLLQLVDPHTHELYYFKTNFQPHHDDQTREFLKGLRIPLSLETGTAASVIRNRRPVFFARFSHDKLGDTDPLDRLVKIAGLTTALIVPLWLNDELVGMLYFSNYTNRLKLSKLQMASIARFCEQVLGAIKSSSQLEEIQNEREKSDRLLRNILPDRIARELKEKGHVKPVLYDSATILFTDFKGFTKVASGMGPEELLEELDAIFLQFDRIAEKHGIEKLKTIGDAYMCAGGLPEPNESHVLQTCLAALELQSFMAETRRIKNDIAGEEFWELRLGIHTGPVVAGVIGKYKFAYDVCGDAVNVAARMESSGEAGRINISAHTRELVKDYFECEYRGSIAIKNRGEMDMYFLNRITPAYSRDTDGLVPAAALQERIRSLQSPPAG